MNLIGNGMLALLQDRGELERLAADPALAKSGVEEFLRHDGPASLTARTALEDVSFGDRVVRAGRVIVVLIGAVNRDPEVFADPDRLDLGREPNRHVAFSAGSHFCLGATLARVEAQIAFRELTGRLKEVELEATPAWRDTVTFRGLKSLPVRFAPGS
jgi:cytochrome P450